MPPTIRRSWHDCWKLVGPLLIQDSSRRSARNCIDAHAPLLGYIESVGILRPVRLRKMQAVQRDSTGGFRTNVEAQVAESQLVRVQQDIISSSDKTAKLSLVVGTRTSRPAITTAELEQSERTIDNRRQQLLYAISRMNGAKAVAESLAKKRLFLSSLPAMAEPDKRDQDLLTSNAADLVPIETPWRGTPRSPLFLLETPYRQLIPFSPFDPSLSDANMLVMAKTGGGKTVMVQQFLLMAARSNPLISILERGDSYRPLVELMGGRMITMSLDSEQTINPWDLPDGEREPSKDQVAFLKHLTRHMLGEGGAEDTQLLDNLITEAILRTYKRATIRPSTPIPTFSDLRDELSQWRDEEKHQRVMDEAHLAAIKLRSWTGEKGVYSKLFDRPTTISLDNPWLFFNVEQLSDDRRLETAMSPRGRESDPVVAVSHHFLGGIMSLPNTVLPPKALLTVVGPSLAVQEGTAALRSRLQSKPSQPSRIAVIGNYLPRHCGIATFTTDLCSAISAEYGTARLLALPVNDTEESYDYPARVRWSLAQDNVKSYQEAADFLNFNNIDMVSLQHEYGIFGGPAGSHILHLLRGLKMPVVTTLHTVLREPNPDQMLVLEEIAELSDRLIVMSQLSSQFLQEIFKVPSSKIDMVPHGVPDLPFLDPNFYKDRFGVEGKAVLLTFGLLSPNKGIENVIQALPQILSKHKNVVYIVAGATHPHVLRQGLNDVFDSFV